MAGNAETAALLEAGLPDRWYALLPAAWVGDAPVGIVRLGRRLVLWRDGDGAVHVQADRCPHRGARLSQGHVIDGLLTCTYHGMQFDGEGTVARVPAYPGCKLEGMQGVRSWPAVEKAGCIFAWLGEGAPAPLAFPEEFDDPAWSHFLCSATWKGSYLHALDNLVDPMHGSYLHANSYTLAYGSLEDVMEVVGTEDGFTVRRTQQVGRNFDWTEFHATGADWVRLDLPYPPGAGPGGMFRILGYVTPVDAGACQVFFWRLRKIDGWQRDLWRFMYKSRLEERHWHVLEQDRVVIEDMEQPEAEMLYQHDIGVTHLRRLLHRRARDHLKSRDAAQLAAE